MKKILAFLVMALLAMPLAASAWTPDGDVTVIVAYKAGSGTDTGARLLASQAEKYVGKTLIINNLPGGDGKIGWTELVNSKPDGRTIGFINLPTFTTLAVQPGSTFAVSDVVPVCNQLSETGVVVVRANSPWKSLKELVDACKAKGNLRCSTNGVEASNHTAAQLLATSAGFDYKAIPYGGTADQLLALRQAKCTSPAPRWPTWPPCAAVTSPNCASWACSTPPVCPNIPTCPPWASWATTRNGTVPPVRWCCPRAPRRRSWTSMWKPSARPCRIPPASRLTRRPA